MGTFGFSRVEISFAKEMPKAFESKENMLKEIDSSLAVNDFECSGLSVWFELSSGRLQNLDHQVKQVIRYIRDNKLAVNDIQASAYSECDEGSFQFSEGEDLDNWDLD